MTKHLLNTDVAILMRVNELAARYGLKPYDFGAELWYDAPTEKTVLMFGWTPDPKTVKSAAFSKMAASLGVDGHSGRLSGEDEAIIEALDQALRRVPRGRARG